MSNWIKACIVPGAVFQSVIVGGGYGTGREVVEFVSHHGPQGGLLAVLLIGLLMGLVLAVTYDYARRFSLREYRGFYKKLIGRFWFLYEIVFILALVLVMAVTGSAAGTVLQDSFGLPMSMGIGAMLLIVVVLNFFGRKLVEQTLTAWGLLLSLVLVCYAIVTFVLRGEQIAAAFSAPQIESGWWVSGFQFFLYNVFLAPVVLYAAEHISTRTQAWIAGMIGGLLAVLPAFIFHLTFMAGYPAVLTEPLPTYWMMQQLGIPALLVIYVIVLFGTIAQTGVGVLQGVNERLDNWWRERTGTPLNPKAHAALAAAVLLLSLLLANVGIVDLVAKGYGSLAWFALGLYVLPLLTLGVWQLYRPGQPHPASGS